MDAMLSCGAALLVECCLCGGCSYPAVLFMLQEVGSCPCVSGMCGMH